MRGPNDGQLFKHWREATSLHDDARWPNFTFKELSCPHCDEFYFDNWMFDAIQSVRYTLGKPVKINSAHRCSIHNKHVGGAKNSRHLRLAFDISLRGLEPSRLIWAAKGAGLTTFGFYSTFLHADDRPGRRWSTKSGRKTWGLLTEG